MLDIERAKKDLEYFYNEVVVFEDKDGNPVEKPELAGYQKAFLKWLSEAQAKGAKVLCIPNTRFEIYKRESLEEKQRRKYDIWMEGYAATGEYGHAQCVAEDIMADSFIEAVKKWYYSMPNAESRYGNLRIDGDKASVWGCRLYDNEEEARESFG